MWAATVRVFTATWNAIVGFLVDTWNAIKTTAVNLWNGIVNTVMAIIAPFVENIRASFARIVNGVRMIWEGLKLYFSAAWTVIKNFLGCDPFDKGSLYWQLQRYEEPRHTDLG
ncbi:hypothetical protein [Paenibacillus melissococcoides]|uniref:hypothetical protein n=1 Tax=Paenibacillus melissococcoides TaxID=2912268 RepID=UPI0021C4BC8A|nr:hypothetical protein [Paenibacillus melissococcoides]CAH8708616.1 hypothetical protein HTL2_002045 [Paenibacillus melissococcoides]CAH8718620.1 hypothetical protein HTL2_005335 [Paenibacillus melissococcoides]